MVKGSAGGKARAITSRREAIEKYYLNPGKCLQCGKIIEVREGRKVSDIKKKKCCSISCASRYKNPPKEKIPKKERKKGKTFSYIEKSTKGELFGRCKNWQSARTCIRRHAAYIYKKSGKPNKCNLCEYDKHYEIAHIKPVSNFPDDTYITEINHPDNLIGLCPNCHWEFDNKSQDRAVGSSALS